MKNLSSRPEKERLKVDFERKYKSAFWRRHLRWCHSLNPSFDSSSPFLLLLSNPNKKNLGLGRLKPQVPPSLKCHKNCNDDGNDIGCRILRLRAWSLGGVNSQLRRLDSCNLGTSQVVSWGFLNVAMKFYIAWSLNGGLTQILRVLSQIGTRLSP